MAQQTTDDAGEAVARTMDRRRFLKMAGIGAGAVAVLAFGSKFLADKIVPAAADPRLKGSAADSWVMLIDLKKCDGCGACTQACSKAHYVPSGQQWIRVYQVQDETGGSYYLPRPCFNCRNAPCVKVCPVGATYVDPDGTILVDQTRCIGCRYCMAACPYGARSFNWVDPRPHIANLNADFPTRTKGVVEKCTFCSERLAKGQLPACVEACPEKALVFGDVNDPKSEIRQLLAKS